MMAPLLRNHLHISRPPKPKYDTREVGLYILRTCIYFCMTQFSKILVEGYVTVTVRTYITYIEM